MQVFIAVLGYYNRALKRRNDFVRSQQLKVQKSFAVEFLEMMHIDLIINL